MTNSTDLFDGVHSALAFKAPCLVSSDTNITLSGLQTVGGVALAEGDRVLVRGQTNTIDNGIWVVSTGAWSRSPDFDGRRDAVDGTLVYDAGGDAVYRAVCTNPYVPGSSALTFQLVFFTSFLQSGTGAVARTALAKMRETVSVQDFGAVGDGVTDDTAAVQSALYSGAGSVFVSGTCLISSTLLLPSNIRLFGFGSNAGGFKLADGANVQLMKAIDQENIRIDGLTFDGNKANQSAIGTTLLTLDGVQHAQVRNNLFKDAWTSGVRVEGSTRTCQDVWVVDNEFEGIAKSAIQTAVSRAAQCHFNRNTFRDCDTDGNTAIIHVTDGATYCEVIGNILVGGGGLYSIEIGHGGPDVIGCVIANNIVSGQQAGASGGIQLWEATHCIVSGNHVNGCTAIVRGAIGILSGNNCIFSGNTISSTQGHGIHIDKSASCLVTGNLIQQAGLAANNVYSGVFLTDDGVTLSRRNVVTGNRINTSGAVRARYGIAEDNAGGAAPNENLISGNYPFNHATANILKSGAATIVRQNAKHVTESKGTGTVASGTTSIAVAHGLSVTPALDDLQVTPTNSLGNATKFWISTPTSTQFTINVDVDPGASTATFMWQAQVL